MPKDPETPKFEKLLAELVHGGVDFALVGGLAVGLNGYPRATMDVDILVANNRKNIERLLGVLSGWGEGFARELSLSDFTDEAGCITVAEDFDLDIFTRMMGKSLEEFRQHVLHSADSNLGVPFLDAQALIELKEYSVREKDQLDVLVLRRILCDQQTS